MSKALNDFALNIIKNYKDDFAFVHTSDAVILQRESVSVAVRRVFEETKDDETFDRYSIVFRIHNSPEQVATIGLGEGSYSLRVACVQLFDHLEKKKEKEKEVEDIKFIKEFEKYLPEERVYFGADF